MIYLIIALMFGMIITLGIMFFFTARIFYQQTRRLEVKIMQFRQWARTWASSRFANKSELDAFCQAFSDMMTDHRQCTNADLDVIKLNIQKIRAIFDDVMKGE